MHKNLIICFIAYTTLWCIQLLNCISIHALWLSFCKREENKYIYLLTIILYRDYLISILTERETCFDNFAGLDGLCTKFFRSCAGFIAFIFDLLKFFIADSKKLFLEVKVNPYILKLQSFHKQSKTSSVDVFRWVSHTHTHIHLCAWLFVCVKFREGKYKFSR